MATLPLPPQTALCAPPRAARPATASAAVPVWPVVLFTYLLLLPPQSALNIGGFVVPFYRALLMGAAPWLIYSIPRQRIRLCAADWFLLLAVAWIFISLSQTESSDRILKNGGALFFDIGAAYFMGRVSLANTRSLRVFLILVAPGYLVAGLLVFLEAVTGHYFVQPFFIGIFGSGGENATFSIADRRLGMLRGVGPFAHPILAGLDLACLLPLYALSGIRRWPRAAGLWAAMLSLFTLSSAAVLALGIQAALMGYNALTTRFRDISWAAFVKCLFALVVFLQVFTKSGPVGLAIRFLAIDKWTAYYRTLIWQYGSITVNNHPWFGIGFEDWPRPAWMPGTVDNYWLLVAMQYGVPGVIPRALLVIYAIVGTSLAASRQTGADRDLVRALAISLALLALMAFTVAFWGNAQSWFYLIVGIAVAQARRPSHQPAT